MWIRRTFSTMLASQFRLRLRPFEVGDWSASAVVLVPHPDDEMLGCGGVAAKKIASGAQVRFVFCHRWRRLLTATLGILKPCGHARPEP
ncbi:PIG-L family deacetylase [Mesorhizobium sp.]|uniref:PIG-L family deacetylase n=1 Tax=Mesorhizobium sp. TaxID=1871066 RepID=UPI00338D5B55